MAEFLYRHPPASMMIRQRRNWTPEEDVILKREVKRAQLKGDNVSWHSIAAFLPRRTNKDCRKRWYGTAAAKVRKGPWTEAEDERLRKAIERHGTKWAVVAAAVGTRLPDQCSKRWSHAINPEIDHSPWTPQEDQMLIQYVNKHGHYWQQIVSLYLPGRSSLAAKNRYHILQRRVEKELRQVGDGLHMVDSSCSWQEVVWEDSRGRGDRDLFSSTMSEPMLGATVGAASFQANPSLMNWLPMASHRPIPLAHTESMTPSRGAFSPLDISLSSTLTDSAYTDLLLEHGIPGTSSPMLTPALSCASFPDTDATTSADPLTTQRKVYIRAMCSTDNLSALLDAVTKFSVSAVIQTGELAAWDGAGYRSDHNYDGL